MMCKEEVLLVEAFKKVKFTRGKKNERLSHLKCIQRNYMRRCVNTTSKSIEIFARVESVLYDRSCWNRFSNLEKVAVLFILICCDFGDSIAVSEEDFYWIKSVKSNFIEILPIRGMDFIANIIFCCGTVRNIFR